MSRPKIKNGTIKSVNLSEEEIELAGMAVNIEGFRSDSEYIGWLIRNHSTTTNPVKFLKELDKQETEIQERLEEIRNKRKEVIKNIELSKEIELAKSKKRPEAIKIIQKKLIDGDIFEAERLARNWGIMLNCPASELLAETMILIRKNGKQ